MHEALMLNGTRTGAHSITPNTCLPQTSKARMLAEKAHVQHLQDGLICASLPRQTRTQAHATCKIASACASVGSSTYTGWKRRSSAASCSMCLRCSSSVVAPRTCSQPSGWQAGRRLLKAAKGDPRGKPLQAASLTRLGCSCVIRREA